ncbi:MAG TPA: M20/M25/M40 family metallo-hydrolase [Chloroflexota bacterium]|nr:M20/M25/M40 family metallo-hydrolase [Chloroflexota bacterium]
MTDDLGRFRDELARLTSIDGVSGHEQAVVAYLREQMTPLADEVSVDPMGNLYARRNGGNGPHLMVEAHSDEIGGLVSAITAEGFLRFQAVGGVNEIVLTARRVRVAGHPGIIGIRPGHLLTAADARTVPGIEDLYIDLGLESAEEVRALGIRPGDQVVWESELQPTSNPNRINGKGIDNRSSCLILLEMMRSLQGQELPGTLTAVVAVQEEVGLKGARVAAEKLRPEAALVIDTVPCPDTPDIQVNTFPVTLGRGPVFQVSSGSHASGYIMPETIRDYLIQVADAAGIPYQLGTLAYTDTDASAIRDVGISTAVATIPRRYSHSPVEMLDLNDALATLRLAQEVVRTMGEFPRGIVPSRIPAG